MDTVDNCHSPPPTNVSTQGFFGKEQRQSLFSSVRNVGGSAKMLGQTTAHQAKITIWVREMKSRKQQFGLELYEAMERNRSMGEKSGGEAAPEVVEAFSNCSRDIQALGGQRSKKQSELIKAGKPKALCYQQSTGESTVSDASESSGNSSSPKGNWFVKQARNTMQKTTNTMQNTTSKAKLKTDISGLEKEMSQRKRQFGLEMYDIMAYCIDDYEARDAHVGELYRLAKKDIDTPLAKVAQAENAIQNARTSASVLIAHSEINDYINSNPSMWAMLGVNIGISEAECKRVAYRVVIELASGVKEADFEDCIITKKQFQNFQKLYVQDPKGSQEFFHRSVFTAFDSDGNGVLDMDETDRFLDTFYVTGSIFQGDARLPEKEELKRLILEKLDENGDGEFTFDEIRSLISGSAVRGAL